MCIRDRNRSSNDEAVSSENVLRLGDMSAEKRRRIESVLQEEPAAATQEDGDGDSSEEGLIRSPGQEETMHDWKMGR